VEERSEQKVRGEGEQEQRCRFDGRVGKRSGKTGSENEQAWFSEEVTCREDEYLTGNECFSDEYRPDEKEEGRWQRPEKILQGFVFQYTGKGKQKSIMGYREERDNQSGY
jgi:hypothetical protein